MDQINDSRVNAVAAVREYSSRVVFILGYIAQLCGPFPRLKHFETAAILESLHMATNCMSQGSLNMIAQCSSAPLINIIARMRASMLRGTVDTLSKVPELSQILSD